MKHHYADINEKIVAHLFIDQYDSAMHPDFTEDDEGFDELVEKLEEYGWYVQINCLENDNIYVTIKSKPETQLLDDALGLNPYGIVVGKDEMSYGVALSFLKTMGIL